MQQLIISLLAISSLAAVLALLLEIAHRYLADYGECKIEINKQKELVVTGGSPLLFSLMEEGIFIPSACGGRGTCSLCKVRVPEGGGPVLPTETPYLSPAELEENVRLSCQVKVRGDLQLVIPEELFLVKEFRVTVTSISDMTPTIKGVFFSIVSPPEGITFKPGQYVQLQLPREKGSGEPEYRAYSICSSCADSHDLELLITKVPDGVVSSYVHEKLRTGDELTITGPFGDFYFQEESRRDILLIATGSGLAPIRSILQHIERQEIKQPVTLFFGARTPADLLYHDELLQRQERMANFSYVPTLSRAQAEDNWPGAQGRVTDLIEERVEQGADLEVYICGAPEMVEACEELLLAKGVPQEQIHYDKFT